ncbi:MAG: DUF1611 domain-containing protein [Steroidobacteraceae bacterium]|jgi:uncharacterized NAD-dependent epimerase/dehydratase family protein|nr:DUF1611 domain-containing protein [Steroidobacteraceae bacterium]
MSTLVIQVERPFVVFLGDVTDDTYAKTGLGLVQWRREDCLGQVRLPGATVDAGVPNLTIASAKAAGARSLVFGVAAVGGGLPEHWLPTLRDAAAAGIDIVAGMHLRLATLPGLAQAAERGGARLVDVRVPPPGLPVGTGRKRSGLRLLTVGTDCACGKKYTALAVDAELRRRGLKSDFRATGQTGIMIAGEGLPIDAVVSDFVTGAAEVLSPDNDADHWDVVEGQGAIFHPGYLQVTVGLLVGSQPDAFVVCHDPTRTHIAGWPHVPLRSIAEVVERTIAVGSLTNPSIRCVGVALNTSKVPAAERAALIDRFHRETGLPCVDPIANGVGPIVDRLLEEFRS